MRALLTDPCRDAAHPVGLPEWLEVFRHSIPTFKNHALTDATVPEHRREVSALGVPPIHPPAPARPLPPALQRLLPHWSQAPSMGLTASGRTGDFGTPLLALPSAIQLCRLQQSSLGVTSALRWMRCWKTTRRPCLATTTSRLSTASTSAYSGGQKPPEGP